MRESTIENYLVERVKAMGGEVRKVKWIGRHGAPDRLVMLPPMGIPAKQPSAALLAHWDALMTSPQEPTPAIAAEIMAINSRIASHTPSRTIWVELKAPGEKAKPHQVREHERMRKMGQRVEIVDSFERVDEVLA